MSSCKSLAQPRTSCTKRSWWTTRTNSRTPTVVERRRLRRPLSPPGAIRSGSQHSPRPSPRSTCTPPTAIVDCTSCRDRRGCRTVVPEIFYFVFISLRSFVNRKFSLLFVCPLTSCAGNDVPRTSRIFSPKIAIFSQF